MAALFVELPMNSVLSKGSISQQLRRDRATIYLEMKYNRAMRGYLFNQAQKTAKTHRRAASPIPWRLTPLLCAKEIEKLGKDRSLEQISCRL